MVEYAAIAGTLYLLSAAAGIWLSRRGRPLNMPLSALHKLLSLAAVVYIALLVFDGPGLFRKGSPQAVLGILALALAAALIATGAVLSGKKPARALKTAHAASAILAAVFLGGALVL